MRWESGARRLRSARGLPDGTGGGGGRAGRGAPAPRPPPPLPSRRLLAPRATGAATPNEGLDDCCSQRDQVSKAKAKDYSSRAFSVILVFKSFEIGQLVLAASAAF